MIARKASVSLIVTIVVATVFTLSLSALQFGFYLVERERALGDVNLGLELTTQQLAVGLGSSLSNYDYAQVDRIIEGVMQDRNIYGIMVQPLDPSRSSPVLLRAVVRDDEWGVRHTDSPISGQSLIAVDRMVSFSDEVIGKVRVFGTSRFAEADLQTKMLWMSGAIALLDVILIGLLQALLWRIVVRPLRAVQEFAVTIGSGEDTHVKMPIARFRGELESLSSSIESMVGFLRVRCYRDLQGSQAALRLTRFAIEHSSDAMFLIRPDGTFAYVNEAACLGLGYTREELLSLDLPSVDVLYTADKWPEHWEELRKQGSMIVETRHRAKDGREIAVEVSTNHFAYEQQEYNCTFARDITARKQAEEDRARLETQLHQVLKMESIGRLAGGVAHDFNNMLGAILGHTDLAMAELDQDSPLHAHLSAIAVVAERSANLTRQLLAFARKQTIAPTVLDLNELITGMLKMLYRLIGEDIRLHWRPSAELWAIKMDPSQIDQILANLCLNARDAIDNIGQITIETANKTFDEEYCATHAGHPRGEYVQLCVSDTGCGMDQHTLTHIFEPFFTTKGEGAGTGLGLATVYGIVKQNQGFINVCSEPGQGTTFAISLPRYTGTAEPKRVEKPTDPVVGGSETVLLVEDEPVLMQIVALTLEGQGYTVLAANTPSEAMRLAREHARQIHLLLTDVVMPEMNGRDLANHLLALHPHLKLLFMSGYTANVIAHHGVLDDGVSFIQKPFSKRTLAAKVRETLDVRAP